MSKRPTGFKSGDWLIVCDRCAFIIMASESKHEYEGTIVCKDCYETRNSLELTKARKDRIIPPFLQPEPEDIFINVSYTDTNNNCTWDTMRCQADFGAADCATVGVIRLSTL